MKASTILATVLQAIAAIHYDKVMPIHDLQNAPDSQPGQLFNPFFRVRSGCESHPAVDETGALSDGLDPVLGQLCSPSFGQAYTRSAAYKDKYAVMFAYYFPQEVTSPGKGLKSVWLHLIIWLSSVEAKAADAIAYRSYGRYVFDLKPDPTTTRYHVIKDGGELKHDADMTGNLHPLVDWDYMDSVPKNALASANFGPDLANQVPFVEEHFWQRLADAYPPSA